MLCKWVSLLILFLWLLFFIWSEPGVVGWSMEDLLFFFKFLFLFFFTFVVYAIHIRFMMLESGSNSANGNVGTSSSPLPRSKHATGNRTYIG